MLNGNILTRLPPWLSRWFGYRSAPPPKPSERIIWIWSFVGTFCGVSVIQAVFQQAQYFASRKVPPLIASYVSPAAYASSRVNWS